MKKRFLFLVGFFLVFLPGPLKAGEITFDGIQWLDPSGTIDSSYGDYSGFFTNWMQILNQAGAPENGFESGIISEEWVTNLSVLINQTFFSFTSEFSVSPQDLYNYLDSSSYPVDFETFVASVGMNDELPSWLQTDMGSLYTLSLLTYGLQSAMDDYVYNYYASDAEPVPEPGTLLLLGSAVIGLIGARKRLKNISVNQH